MESQLRKYIKCGISSYKFLKAVSVILNLSWDCIGNAAVLCLGPSKNHSILRNVL